VQNISPKKRKKLSSNQKKELDMDSSARHVDNERKAAMQPPLKATERIRDASTKSDT
jgi:hypothetical protein